MMKKVLVVLIIAALSLSMLAVFSGCGTDQNKENARTHMQSGDTYMAEAEAAQKSLQDLQAEMTTKIMQGDTSMFTADAGAALKQQLDDIFTEMDKNLKSASDEYTAISTIDDVQDYKDYANLMLEAIAKYQQLLTTAESLVESLSAMIANLPAGQQPDLTQLMQMPEIQDMMDLQEQGDALVKEADQLKTDKKLED